MTEISGLPEAWFYTSIEKLRKALKEPDVVILTDEDVAKAIYEWLQKYPPYENRTVFIKVKKEE